MSTRDPGLEAYIAHCVKFCTEEFAFVRSGAPPPPPLWPLLERGSNDMQLRHQAGHEVFHWLRTPAERTPGILHWTHEMLAIEVSHRAMRAAAIPGCAEYLNDSDTYYRALAPGRGLEFGHRPSTPVGMSSI